METYIPVSQDVLGKIAELGNLDAVYDITAESLPKQSDTVVLMAVKVVDGSAFTASERVFSAQIDVLDLAGVAASLAQGMGRTGWA